MKHLFGCLIFFLMIALSMTSGHADSSHRELQYSPDGNLLLVRVSSGFRVISTKDGKVRSSWKAAGRPHIETFSANSKSIILSYEAASDSDGQAILVETDIDGDVTFTYSPDSPFRLPSTLAASRSSELFLTAHWRGDAQIWRQSASAPERPFRERAISDALFGPGDDKITIIRDTAVTVRYLSTWGKIASFTADEYDYFEEAMFTRNQRSILIGFWNFYDRYNVYSRDAQSLEFNSIHFKNMGSMSVGLNTLATCLSGQNKAAIRKFSMDIKGTVKLPYKCVKVALSPDSSQLTTMDFASTRVDAWNVKTGKLVWSIKKL